MKMAQQGYKSLKETQTQCSTDFLEEIGKRTGYPVLINTSFNVSGEPIVERPVDALRTFASCGIEYLIMGDYLVKKKGREEN